jgi:hypothetical protein
MKMLNQLLIQDYFDLTIYFIISLNADPKIK